MGIIRNNFAFLMGNFVGIYIAQNYDVPNIKRKVNEWISKAKQMEERYRKQKKKGEE